MFLTIHNLPSNIRYPEIKQLILSKCGLAEVILDNLITEGSNKKVTVGLADENDAAILVRKINGLFVGGQQLYVEKTKQKKAEQPYRSSKDFRAKEVYLEEMELTSFGNSSNGQDSQNSYTNGNQNDASQRMYDSSQSMYTPNGQIMWDQAVAMMMNMGNTTSMGAGGTMYMPAPNSFMGFGGQMQSQVPLTPQFSGVLTNTEQNNQENDRERGADCGNPHQSNDPPFDTPPNRGQNLRKHYDNYSKWDESVSRMAPETPTRHVLPTSLERWSRDSYNAEDNLKNNRESGYGQRRETLGSEPFNYPMDVRSSDRYDRESAGPNLRAVSQRQPASVDPWEKLDSSYARNLIEENPFNEPWHQMSDVQRPSRQNLRFDDFETFPALHSRFDDPKTFVPRYNQDYSERQTKWDRPNQAPSWPKKRSQVSEPPPGSNDRSAVSGVEKYIPKFYQDRRLNDEPPSKRLAGPTRPDNREADRKRPILLNPSTQQKRPLGLPQGKPGVPPKPKTTICNLLQRDITWRGQAASEIARDMMGKLSSVMNPPKNDPILVALRRGIRTRIDILVGNKKSVPMKEIIDVYRKKFDTSTDKQFYDAIVESVMEQKQAAESKTTSQLPGPSPDEAQTEKQPPIKRIQSDFQTSVTEPNIAGKSTNPQPSSPTKLTPAKPKPGKNMAEPATQLHKNQDKLPQYPFASKQMYKEQKKAQKMELISDCYDLDAVTQKAVDELADGACDIFMGECDGATTEYETRICERISDHASDEFRRVIRLLVTKRLLNIKSNLQVRVYFDQKPKNSIMAQFTPFFRRFGALSLKKSAKKNKMYIVTCDSYENYDALCAMGQAEVCGYTLTFKPLYVTGPGVKLSKSQVFAQRLKSIKNQIGTGDFLEKVEYPGQTKKIFDETEDDCDHIKDKNVVEGDENNTKWQPEDNLQDAFYHDKAEGSDDEGTPQNSQAEDADDDGAPQNAGYQAEDDDDDGAPQNAGYQAEDDDDDVAPQNAGNQDQAEDADYDVAPQNAGNQDQAEDDDDDVAPQNADYQAEDTDDDVAPQNAGYQDQAEGADEDGTQFPNDSLKHHEEEQFDAAVLDDRVDENIPDVDNVNEDDLEEW